MNAKRQFHSWKNSQMLVRIKCATVRSAFRQSRLTDELNESHFVMIGDGDGLVETSGTSRIDEFFRVLSAVIFTCITLALPSSV
jgi:hypothetical protein